MYLAIDIGGTKTLIGLYSESGELSSRQKVKTSPDYDEFITSISNCLKDNSEDISKCVAAVPGLLDRKQGIVRAVGNLPCKDEPIAKDLSDALGGTKVIIENDTKLAGLAESKALDSEYSRVLYITISTGIGTALIVDGRIVKELQDSEAGKMPLLYDGSYTQWEEFASGRAIAEKYGAQASEITDPGTWQEIGMDIGYGVGVLCSNMQPEVIVLGGGAGQYADKFSGTIKSYLKEHLHPVVMQPRDIRGPALTEDNVLRGCYELATDSN